MARLSLPTKARLSSSLRVDPTNKVVLKTLNRLSRPSLLSLVLDWLDEGNQYLCPPILRHPDADDDEDENDLYPPMGSLEELQEVYSSMQARKGSRREVVDRILEGDWRHGLSLYQLAMADLQYLYDHPGSLKWSAYRIQRLKTPAHEDDAEGPEKADKESLTVPRFHPSTFLQNLQAGVLPDVKAHYNFDRPKDMPLLLLRIFILDSPYNTTLAVSSRSRGHSNSNSATNFDASRTIYIAFPDASPHIYISKSASSSTTAAAASAAGEAKSLRALVVDGIPKALSRPRERYALRPTNLSTKNLGAMLAIKGAGRTNAAGAGWGSVYAGTGSADLKADTPLQTLLPTPPLSEEDGGGPLLRSGRKRASSLLLRDPVEARREREGKRARVVAQARFGDAAKPDDGKGVERVDVLLEDPFPVRSAADETNIHQDHNDDDAEDARAASSRRRKSNKGRRSVVDLSLSAEGEDADDDGGDRRGGAEEADEEEAAWKPQVQLTFHGPHVFAGVRQLVEAGVVDGEAMPGWMTGEEGVTAGAVRHGRIRGHKGSGL
ncbi:CHL4-domain-containing protein [Xylariaceae sp. FL0662B]|nr:CHL4-domain-containing protein [Xylariaceae sp. FL0662B]